ncbi:MAG: PspC domain-containing protein [Clostridia bacterium]|nr:PspC domain-containing protein [Clostridia bacterium]
MTNKKLYKSSTDKKLCGVCAGFANFFNIDPTIVRVIYACVALFTTGIPFVLLYIILAFILPEDNGYIDTDATDKTDN